MDHEIPPVEPPAAPPKQLGKRGAAFWTAVHAAIQPEDDQQELVMACCELLDSISAARRRLRKDGRFVTDRFGQVKLHPACEEIRKCWSEFRAMRREIGIDLPPGDVPRGPTSPSFR